MSPALNRATDCPTDRATSRWSERDERGAVTSAWVLLIASAAFTVLVGLVYDGGNAIDMRLEAKRAAEQAARAGADEISMAAYRSGREGIDPAAATRRAQDVLAAAGWTGTVRVQGDRVTVTVSGSSPNQVLGVIGLESFRVRETGTAQAITAPQ